MLRRLHGLGTKYMITVRFGGSSMQPHCVTSSFSWNQFQYRSLQLNALSSQEGKFARIETLSFFLSHYLLCSSESEDEKIATFTLLLLKHRCTLKSPREVLKLPMPVPHTQRFYFIGLRWVPNTSNF